MCCKWQPRHMDEGTVSAVGQCHCCMLVSFSILKPLANCWHPWATNTNALPAPAPFPAKWKTCGWLQLTRTAFEIEIQSPWTELLTQCNWPKDWTGLDWTSCLAIGQGQINWLQYLWLMTLADCVFNHLLTKLLKQLNESLPNAYAGSQRQLSLLLGAGFESLLCI